MWNFGLCLLHPKAHTHPPQHPPATSPTLTTRPRSPCSLRQTLVVKTNHANHYARTEMPFTVTKVCSENENQLRRNYDSPEHANARSHEVGHLGLNTNSPAPAAVAGVPVGTGIPATSQARRTGTRERKFKGSSSGAWRSREPAAE